MTQPSAGNICWKLFGGEPQKVVEEANAFVDEHDNLKFPIRRRTHGTTTGRSSAILLTITAPSGAGKPDIVRTMPIPPNGRGA